MSDSTRKRHQQAGLSLVELMVALVIGLLLLSGVIQIFLGSKQGYNTQENISRVQETGRFATLFLTRSVRQAGYMSDHTRRPAQIYTANTAVTGTNAAAGNDPATPDSITVSYQGTADNNTLDCRGAAVPGPPAAAIVANAFTVDVATQTLRCQRFNANGTAIDVAPQPLVSGVQDMQILYGVDTTPANDQRTANRYVTANQIPAVANWTDVRSVRITLLVSDDDGQLEPKTFTTTITIRNRLDNF